jgi:hypothetical protein
MLVMVSLWPSNSYAQRRLDPTRWPAGTIDRQNLPDNGAVDYDFQGYSIDRIEGWLKWFGVSLPIDVSGDLSGWLWGQRSSTGWFDFKSYRVEGMVKSPRISIRPWVVKHATLRFGYFEGVWYVGTLRGQLESSSDESSFGLVNVVGIVPTNANQSIELTGSVEQIDIHNFLTSLTIPNQLANDSGSLQFNASVPLTQANQLPAWRINGDLNVDALRLPTYPSAEVRISANAADAKWAIPQGSIRWAEHPFIIQGSGLLKETYPFEFNVSGNEVSISELLMQLGYEQFLPSLSGMVNLVGNVRGDAANGILRANSTFRSSAVRFDSLQFQNVAIDAAYQPEKLSLELVSLQLGNGLIAGESLWIDPAKRVTPLPSSVNLTVEDVQLSELLDGFLNMPILATANGRLSLESEISEPNIRWRSQGELTLTNPTIASIAIEDSKVTWQKSVDSSVLAVQLQSVQDKLQADLEVQMGDRNDWGIEQSKLIGYRAQGKVKDLQIALSKSDVSPIDLALQANGTFELTGKPNQWIENAVAELQNSQFDLNKESLRIQTAIVELSPEEYRIPQFRLLNERGRIAGSAVVRRNGTGLHQLNLRVANVEIAPYLQAFATHELSSLSSKVSLETRLSKKAKTAEGFADWLDANDWDGDVRANLSNIYLGPTYLGYLEGEGALQDRSLEAEIQGTILNGKASITARLPFIFQPEKGFTIPSSTDHELSVDAELSQLELPAILANVSQRHRVTAFSGFANIVLRGRGQGDSMDWNLDASVPLLAHHRKQIAKDVVLKAQYHDGQLQLTELNGEVGGGRIDARGSLQLPLSTGDDPEGDLDFDAQRIQVGDVVLLAAPDLGTEIEGIASYRGSIRWKNRTTVFGDAQIIHGKLFSLPVQNAHGELRMTIAPNGSLRSVSSRNISGTALGGNFLGNLEMAGNAPSDLKVNGRISNGKMDQLGKALGFDRIVGSGRFDGDFDLNSRDASSISALNGRVRIEFEDGDAQSIPILPELSRFVPLFSLASTKIRSGSMHASIGQGEIRIRDLLLNSDAYWIFANGDASLTGGQIDVDGMLQTGRGLDQQISQNLIEKLLLDVIPQAALLSQLNDFIRNRTLYFHIDGTANRPLVRPKAAQTVGRAILQNLRRQWLPIPTITASSAAVESE